MNWLGVNWKTTLAGIGQILGSIAGIVIAVASGNLPAIISTVVSSIGGISGGVGMINAKDKDVTGGVIPATKEASARISAPGATAAPTTPVITP